jgi:vacuolar-type H+-ATPase subunit H
LEEAYAETIEALLQYLGVKIMERLWEELKKIEKEAEHIHSKTLEKSEELIAIAKKDAEKLLSDSKKHVEAEADELLKKYAKEATKKRNFALKKNEEIIKELRKTVEKRFNKAVNTIFDAVLGKIKG